MIKRFKIGNPIKTEAVVKEIETEKGEISYFKQDGESIVCKLREKDIVYGLGQTVRGLNKRGYLYESKCSDEPSHWEDRTALYGAHNFFMISGEEVVGFFVDTPSIVSFDIGFTKLDELRIQFTYPDYDFYVITGKDENEVVKQFRELIGKSYLPPKWAFGYGQSRWSYNTADEVREVVRKHRENKIPLDSVYLDIDYMERYKDFTVDETCFPDFENFVKEMKEQKVHLVPIIDAGVKIEKGYDVYEEGVEKGYFCKKEDGTNLVCGVWPGDVHFPDFLKKEAREWFGKKYDFLLNKGIDGFWNDMNEPAIFYAKDRLLALTEKIKGYVEEGLNAEKVWSLKDDFSSLQNNVGDYETFYHEMEGEKYRHDVVHNIYGYNMTRAAGEYFRSLGKEILMFSRASYIGAHRYGGIWQGDNNSCWSHIKLSMDISQSLNMVGFLYNGADLGGFGGHVSPDLMIRWLQFAMFTPLMRNHSAIGTRRQELYEFSEMPIMRKMVELRYGLLDYLYEEVKKAVEGNTMFMRPLAFDYREDEFTRKIDDQILVGDSLMIAPIYRQNEMGRYVYLPEEMTLLRCKSLEEIEESKLPKGHHYLDVDLDEVLIFIRKGKSLSLTKGGMTVEEAEHTKGKVYGKEGE